MYFTKRPKQAIIYKSNNTAHTNADVGHQRDKHSSAVPLYLSAHVFSRDTSRAVNAAINHDLEKC